MSEEYKDYDTWIIDKVEKELQESQIKDLVLYAVVDQTGFSPRLYAEKFIAEDKAFDLNEYSEVNDLKKHWGVEKVYIDKQVLLDAVLPYITIR